MEKKREKEMQKDAGWQAQSRALVEGLSAAVPSTREEAGRCTAVLAETGLSAAASPEEEDERLCIAAA